MRHTRPTGGVLFRWLPVLGVGIAVLARGTPAGVSDSGWWFAAVFAATIVGFLTRPLAMGPLVLVALVVLLVAGAYGSGEEATKGLLAGFADSTVWLVVAAFLLSGTVVRSGFGRRIALLLIRSLGGTTLGLGYAVSTTELLLGPIIPSNTARGGVVFSVVNSLAQVLGAAPDNARRRTGGYLVLCGSHANLVAAAMFFTGMAANPKLGVDAQNLLGVEWDWTTWLQGSWLPGLLSFATLPLILYWLQRPELAHSPAARDDAAAELKTLGPWSRRELAVAGVLFALVVFWATEPMHGIQPAGIALVGIAAILVLRLDEWRDIISDGPAWDSLIWLGGLVGMADRLKAEGVIDWFANLMREQVAGYTGVAAALMIALIYFFSMYGFSMLTGHIVAMAGIFFIVSKAADCPPLLVVAMISYFSNLCGCLTNYSTGQVVMYFGLGYVSPQRWFGIGLAVAAAHLTIWLGVGMPYWKLLGWW